MPKLTRKQKRLLKCINDGIVKVKEYTLEDKNVKSKYVLIDSEGNAGVARRSDVQALIDNGFLKMKEKTKVNE
jgi:hypothetical protein